MKESLGLPLIALSLIWQPGLDISKEKHLVCTLPPPSIVFSFFPWPLVTQPFPSSMCFLWISLLPLVEKILISKINIKCLFNVKFLLG